MKLEGQNRSEKFKKAVAAGKAVFRLEAQRADSWSREWVGVDLGRLWRDKSWSSGRAEQPWIPVATLTFEAPVTVDQGKLKYHPKLQGRGLRPIGLVTAIRGSAYRASSDARPASEPSKTPGVLGGLDEAKSK